MMKIKILCLMPIACLAAAVQVPGEWSMLSDAVVPKVEHPAIPRVFSGQRSTLINSKVRAQDGVKTAELKSMPGVRIEEGPVSLVYSASEEVNEFARMGRPPASDSVWYESTFWTGGESWARVGKTWMHPGNKSDTARVFVAPKAGRVSVSGVVRKLHLEGDGVKVSVRHNNKVVWSADLAGKDGVGKEVVCDVEVKKGDTLRFIVNRGGSYSCDTTEWDPIVTYAGGPAFQASEGFSDKQEANGWRYECTGGTVAAATVPVVYGVGKDFRIFKGSLDSTAQLPVVIVSDGNSEDGFGGYVIVRDTDEAWTLTQGVEGLTMTGPGAVAVVRYDGTWVEGLKVLAEISQAKAQGGIGFEKLGASVRTAYDKVVAGVPNAPELDLFLLAVSEWVQDDKLFGGGDAARVTACTEDQIKRTSQITGKAPAVAGSGWEGYLRARLMKRSALLSDPKLGYGELLFCKRRNPSWNHEVAQYFGWRQRPGGSLFVLEHPGVSMAYRDILNGQMPPGNILEPRLSYDGKKILFSFVATEGALDPRNLPRNETDTNHHYYHIYEIGVDGTGLRQITKDIYDDLMPEWLPDGGIAFVSTRRRASSRCFWWGYSDRWHSYTMYRMQPDGSNIQQISWNDVNEWFPAVSNSGHLLFARWDYIDRDAVTHQNLWSMRPDGTNPMAVWGNELPKPHCTFQAKPIPGSSKIVCVASAHHAITGGPVMLIDPSIHNNSQEAVTRLTPGHYPECERGPNGEWYNAPWPLSENLFLVAYSREGLMYEPTRHNPDYAMGLYVMDDQGNRELIYRDGRIGSTNPTPLAARKMPPVLPSLFNKELADKGMGEMFLSDVYEGLPKAERGIIKEIRVVQVLPKTTRDANNPRIGAAGEENTRAILGVAPVEADGSARFLVPARKAILLQVLDKDGFAYRTMRSSTSLMPGERVSCIGCHENKMAASAAGQRLVTAMKRPAAALTPTPESGRPYGFVENVQPIFDAKCIKCHNDKEAKGGMNLSRTITGANGYTASYQSLCYTKDSSGKTVRRISKKNKRPLVTYFAQRNQIQVTPEGGEDGAIGSGLIQMLQTGHSKVELTAAELRRIGTWIDMNAVFYGVYEPQEQLTMQREGKPVPMPEIE
ncbi:MAG: hypothetical protein PF904_10580 [Kiritimatiellae bacterium]|jgi:hypothetical protein|nr:hypothetical protein [Kiritimatiellia bacterium]